MLCLNRKEHETVIVNSTVVVTVLEIRGNSVRLGFMGRDTDHFLRGELLARPRSNEGDGSQGVPPTADATAGAKFKKPTVTCNGVPANVS